ncbi:hypothetical protein Tco_1548931 [Tanacetum coccineum]
MIRFTSQDTMKMDLNAVVTRSKDTSFQDCDSGLALRGLSSGAGTGVFKYQLREEDWESLVEQIGLEAGMFVVFTKHRFNRLGLMAFDTHADERMNHTCLWTGHSKHFGERNNTFYRRFSSTLDKQRLAIKASFLANHPMHQHRKVLVKHQEIEYEMKMKMDYHKEKPERTNHVGIYGKWKQFGRECGFKHDKMLRIHYIGTARQLDSYDEEDEILIFHERISKKRTKNEAKTTKPDTEWKSVEKTQSSQSPSIKKSTQVNPDKSRSQQVKKNKFRDLNCQILNLFKEEEKKKIKRRVKSAK